MFGISEERLSAVVRGAKSELLAEVEKMREAIGAAGLATGEVSERLHTRSRELAATIEAINVKLGDLERKSGELERGQRGDAHALRESIDSLQGLHEKLLGDFRKLTDSLTGIRSDVDTKFQALESAQTRSSESLVSRIEDRVRSSAVELSATIKTVDAGLDEIKLQANRRLDEINTKIALLVDGVHKIDEELGSDKFRKIKEFDFEKVKKDVEESISERAEYRDLWKAQKLEATAIESLAGAGGDPEIQALIVQKGLEVQIARRDLQQLAVSKAQLTGALKSIPDNEKGSYQRMVANLSYAYALMAQHYKTSRAHVTAVAAEKTTPEMLFQLGIEVLKAAVAAGLSAVTMGVAGVAMPAIIEAINAVTGSSPSTTPPSVEDQIKAALEDQKRTQSIKGVGATGAEKIVALSGLAPSPGGDLTDPFDFFLDQEVQLRKLLAEIASTTDISALKRRTVVLDKVYTLESLRADTRWDFFFSVNSNLDAYNATWARVSAQLAVNMRRMCWRAYCRSQWTNRTFSYSLSVVSEESADSEGYSLEGPASEWHYKVWDSVRTMPRHWEKICSDFRGVEHNASTRVVDERLQSSARRLMENNAWISMAAVQCCQIRRPGDKRLIDMEKRSHLGGVESDLVPVRHSWSDRILVYGDAAKDKVLNEYLRLIDAAGGVTVSISEIRFGRGATGRLNRWTKASGKKGTLSAPNLIADPLTIPKGTKMTVMVSRKDAKGGAARSGGQDAWLRVYRAGTETHSDGKDCALVDVKGNKQQLCWYCEHTPAEDKKLDSFKQSYRLKEVDRASTGSRLISSEGWNYENFPQSGADYANTPGLYCVRLHPRPELMTLEASGGDLQRHVSDEWWFKISSLEDTDKAPNPPQIVWKSGKHALGATSIKGKYKGSNDTGSTLIHVWVDGKSCGSKTVKAEGEAEVEWEISDIPALIGGQWYMATSTWQAATSRDDDVQSESEKYWVRPRTISVEAPVAGSVKIRGFCDAVEGTLLQVGVNDRWPESPFPLVGTRSSEDEGSKIAWEYEHSEPLLTAWALRVRAVARDEANRLRPLAASDPVRVGPPPAPRVDQPTLFGTKVSGTCAPIAGVTVKVKVNNVERGSGVKPKVSGTGWVNWEVDGIPRLLSGQKITAWIKAPDESQSVESDEITIPVPVLPKPTVDPLFAGAKEITGTVEPFADTDIAVDLNGTIPLTIKATRTAEEAGGGKFRWKLSNLKSSGVETRTLAEGNYIEAYTELTSSTDSPKPKSALSEKSRVQKLPVPIVAKPVAGAKRLYGTVAAPPLKDAKVEVKVGSTTLTAKGTLVRRTGEDSLLDWELTDLSGITNDRVVPGQKVMVRVERNGAFSDWSAEIEVPKPAKPTVNALTAGYKIVTGKADNAVEGAEVEVTVGGTAIVKKAKVLKDLTWSLYVKSDSFVPEKGKAVTAKVLIGDSASDASEAVTVGELPVPVVMVPYTGSTTIAGTIDRFPGDKSYVVVTVDDEELAGKADVRDGDPVTWQLTGVPALQFGSEIKARVLRRAQYSEYSSITTVPVPNPPRIYPLMAGATSISGEGDNVPGAKVRLTVTPPDGGATNPTHKAHFVSASDKQWSLSNLAPIANARLKKGSKVSAVLITDKKAKTSASSAEVTVSALPVPRIDPPANKAKQITGGFDIDVPDDLRVNVLIKHAEGNVTLEATVNAAERKWTLELTGFLSRSLVYAANEGGLTLGHTVSAQSVRNGETSDDSGDVRVGA